MLELSPDYFHLCNRAWLLAMVNSVYIAPRSQAALGRLQDRLKTAQASFEVQPRVFYEGFPKACAFVQDVKSASGAAIWKGVFLADVSSAVSPRITLASKASGKRGLTAYICTCETVPP